MRFENVLGTVVCATNIATLEALLSPVGLVARADPEPNSFTILSGGRATFPDPVVEGELVEMALNKMKAAQIDGKLPSFSLLVANPQARAS